jgi:hypothetical protein
MEIKKGNANMNNVPSNVIENVKKYFDKYLPNYEVVKVMRKSSHPLDDYLYMVIARHTNYPEIKRQFGCGEYACWTCWNESTQSLNYGHYDLLSEEVAVEIAMEYYYG